MPAIFTIGLIGDYNSEVTTHQVIPRELQIASNQIKIECRWLNTRELEVI